MWLAGRNGFWVRVGWPAFGAKQQFNVQGMMVVCMIPLETTLHIPATAEAQ